MENEEVDEEPKSRRMLDGDRSVPTSPSPWPWRGRSCNVLVLGDGNFSFSLAFARALLLRPAPLSVQDRAVKSCARAVKRCDTTTAISGDGVNDPSSAPTIPAGTPQQRFRASENPPRRRKHQQAKNRVEIVATSFDGPADLLRKYPESSGILATLRSLGVTVLHNIDATALGSRCVVADGANHFVDECKREGLQPIAQVAGKERDVSSEARDQGGSTTMPTVGGRASGSYESLEASDDGEPGGGRGGGLSLYGGRRYDHVIFNHPHTGTEDMRRHRSFLGHFFHDVVHATTTALDLAVLKARHNGSDDGDAAGGRASTVARQGAASILAPGGVVHVTLAGDQPERWGLCEQAARHGFALIHRRRFPAERIDGYMTKRHQTGRSFQRRSLDSETLSFAWTGRAGSKARLSGGGEITPVVTIGGVGYGDSGEVAKGRYKLAGVRDEARCGTVGEGDEEMDRHYAASLRGTDSGEVYTLPPWLWPAVNMCGDGAKSRDALHGTGELAGRAPDMDVGVPVQTAARDRRTKESKDMLLPEVCALCGKRYKTAQALRTHTRQLHELGQEGGVPLAAKKEERCPHCERVFTSDRALDQHMSAKHGSGNVNIKPDWFVGSIYHLGPPSLGGGLRTANEAFSGEGKDKVAASTLEATEERHRPTGKANGLVSTPRTSDSASCCDICGYWFSTPEDAQQHLDNLRPPIESAVARYNCVRCRKEFGSRRALLQHANFCT